MIKTIGSELNGSDSGACRDPKKFGGRGTGISGIRIEYFLSRAQVIRVLNPSPVPLRNWTDFYWDFV